MKRDPRVLGWIKINGNPEWTRRIDDKLFLSRWNWTTYSHMIRIHIWCTDAAFNSVYRKVVGSCCYFHNFFFCSSCCFTSFLVFSKDFLFLLARGFVVQSALYSLVFSVHFLSFFFASISTKKMNWNCVYIFDFNSKVLYEFCWARDPYITYEIGILLFYNVTAA